MLVTATIGAEFEDVAKLQLSDGETACGDEGKVTDNKSTSRVLRSLACLTRTLSRRLACLRRSK